MDRRQAGNVRSGMPWFARSRDHDRGRIPMSGMCTGPTPARLRLGIDAGGTFPDQVPVDGERCVVASAKSLTTPFDLALGIGGVLAMLPRERLREVVLVALSTTLTTNAVVEGKGAPVCALLAGYDEGEIRSSGLRALLGA